MGRRVRISNDSLNSYGTRVLTSGMDVSQYEKNPVLLYMHERGSVIGYVKDIVVSGDEVSGEPVFDEATELSQRCKKQWEFGSLKMVSVGIDILELSDAAEHIVAGQRYSTVTKSRLYEVSLVDIGSNHDSIVLKRGGMQITFGRDGDCPLPLLNNNNNNNNKKKENEMEIKELALQLGMSETSTEGEVSAKIAELQALKSENEGLSKKLAESESSCEALKLAHITAMVDGAIAEKRLCASKKAHFVELGKEVGAESLGKTLEAMSPQVKLLKVIEDGKTAESGEGAWNRRMEEIRTMTLKK